MASIHLYFVGKQVGDTQKRGKPEMRSSCRKSLDLHWLASARPGRGPASVPTSDTCQSVAILMNRSHSELHSLNLWDNRPRWGCERDQGRYHPSGSLPWQCAQPKKLTGMAAKNTLNIDFIVVNHAWWIASEWQGNRQHTKKGLEKGESRVEAEGKAGKEGGESRRRKPHPIWTFTHRKTDKECFSTITSTSLRQAKGDNRKNWFWLWEQKTYNHLLKPMRDSKEEKI